MRDATGEFVAVGFGLACLGGTSMLLGFVVNAAWKKKDEADAREKACATDSLESPTLNSDNPLYPAV